MNLINKEFAKRSVIYSNNILSLPDIISKLKICGVSDVFHWSNNNLSLIHCSNEHNINAALRQMKTIDFVKFRMMRENGNLRRIVPSKLQDAIKFMESSVKFVEINKCQSVLLDKLYEASSLSDQLKTFYEYFAMSDYDIKLRYCYAMNIERCIQEIVPFATVELFGSSTNGLGKFNSDLDLKIMTKEDVSVHQAVGLLKSVGRHLRSINRSMFNCSVYNCRFPICHFHDSTLGLSVDLSIIQDTVLDMSRILRTLADRCVHFAPLCIVVKHIYIHVGILVDRPSLHFTGFKIVSFIIHFLQTRALLPPLSTLDPHFDYSTHSVDDTSSLLEDFFLYLIHFDPLKYDIDLGDGQLYPKVGQDFLTCLSHLDRSLNIMRNIRQREWDKFTAINKMILLNLKSEAPSTTGLWGLGRFVDESVMSVTPGTSIQSPYQARTMHINK